jgi:hypothetical protein
MVNDDYRSITRHRTEVEYPPRADRGNRRTRVSPVLLPLTEDVILELSSLGSPERGNDLALYRPNQLAFTAIEAGSLKWLDGSPPYCY